MATILDAVGGVLGEAVGIIVSPLPIVALILMLFSRRARPGQRLVDDAVALGEPALDAASLDSVLDATAPSALVER